MTPAQTLACGALKIEHFLPSQNLQMAAIVFLLGKLAGVTDCATILAGAQTMACIDRPLQLPAMLWELSVIIANLPTIATGPQGPAGANGAAGAPGPVLTFAGHYAGGAPPFIPTVGAGQLAIAYDEDTNQPWWYVLGNWQT